MRQSTRPTKIMENKMKPTSFFALIGLVAVVSVVNTWFEIGDGTGHSMEDYDI